jgi:flagellar biosynthesis protein FlhG
MALLLASALAQSGRRTLVIDADFGIGDIATMTNVTPIVGFEDVLTGKAKVSEAALKVSANLWVMGTMAGKSLGATTVTADGIRNCGGIDSSFDTVLIDTPSTLDYLCLSLIGGSDLAITVTTSRIPSIADSYIQLKQIMQSGSRARHLFVVNRVETPIEGDQTVTKFGELVEKFVHYSIPALGTVENDPRLDKAAENQSLLGLTRQARGVARKVENMVKVLADNYLTRIDTSRSIWSDLALKISLKDVAVFDDTEAVVQS